MGTIFVVSPQYLEIVLKESKRFSFNLQGYGSFALANEGLLRVNAVDIIGYAFVADAIPNIGSEEFNHMLEFLNLCNLMGRKKFVLVTRTALHTKDANRIKRFSNLKFYVSNGYEYITDRIITTNVFGSLLMAVREPYRLKDEKEKPIGEYVCPIIHLVPPVSNFVLQCFNDIAVLSTPEQSKEYDEVYQNYVKAKSVLADLRALRIKHLYGENDLDTLRKVGDRIQSSVINGELQAVYLAVYNIVADELQSEV